MAGGMNWNVDEIHLKDYDLSQMPDSPICPILVKLFLQVPRLTVIPPTFFEHMPVLQVLDLSNTNIVSLPTSISSLSLLREFILRDCSALIELPTQIGMLSNLKLFDIQGTQLMFLPKEMGKLKNLEILRVSLSEYAKDYIKSSVNETVIPRKMISELKKLKELCVIISVGPEPEWWEEEVKYIQSELCHLENLETLRWYLPTTEVLLQFLLLERNRVPMYANLSNLMLTVGQHAQLTSCLPHGLEEKFEEFKNCLKWINAEGSMDAISKIMASAEALFLSRHWTIRKLSIFNVTKLKYCLLAECNEMETVVEVDGLSEDVETRIKNGEKVGFELLQYLSIHYMNKLQSIWKGPIGKDSLSKLRILSLHTCPKLTSIFTPTIAQNLSCLAELTVEDCPKVTSLISNESHNIKLGPVLPTLEKIFLLDLPVLVNIFVGRIMLENLRTMLIYSCPRFRDLSNMELPRIKKIEGEDEWWKALDCDKSPWKNIFVQLKKRRALIEQLSEATNSLQHFHDILSHENDEKKLSTLTDIREQMITANTSMETKGYNITDLVQEAQIRWLKPGEVLFILQNFEETQLTYEPPQKPPSGSLFLFNKRVLRFFRKDGHNWRRKMDGRTVREAHERLKVGNVEALNCYYVHSELNPNFQRRTYCMLDQGMAHIVLVHYRDITMSGHSPGAISTFSTGSSTLIQGSSSYGSQLTQSAAYSQFRERYYNTSSPSSIEVSSDAVTKFNRTGSLSYTQGIEEIGGSPNSEIDQALRRIEEEPGLDEDNLEDISAFYNAYIEISKDSANERTYAGMQHGSNNFASEQYPENDEKKSSTLTDIREQMITANTSMETKGERKKGRTKHKRVAAVRKLYDACRDVFANCGPGVVPDAQGIERLKDILNGMTEHDVGVRPNMPFFKVKETEKFPKITYLHLSICDEFSIGIFLLPPTGVLPLHNHPQMTVFSKLLFGTMHIKAYDWVDNIASSSAPKSDSSECEETAEEKTVSVRLAKLKVNSDFTAPCNTSVLYPTDGGNMHCFTAITSCAVLDVLCPPYCDAEGRHCQYYRTHPFTSFSAGDKQLPDDDEKAKELDYAWLEEIDYPAGLSVVGAPYNGPIIVEK